MAGTSNDLRLRAAIAVALNPQLPTPDLIAREAVIREEVRLAFRNSESGWQLLAISMVRRTIDSEISDYHYEVVFINNATFIGDRSQSARFYELSDVIFDAEKLPSLHFRQNVLRIQLSFVRPYTQTDHEFAQMFICRQIDQARQIGSVNSSTATWSSGCDLILFRVNQFLEYIDIPEVISAETLNKFLKNNNEQINQDWASHIRKAHSFAMPFAKKASHNKEFYRSRLNKPEDSVVKMHRDVVSLAKNIVALRNFSELLEQSRSSATAASTVPQWLSSAEIKDLFEFLEKTMTLSFIVLEFAVEYTDSLFPAVAAWGTVTAAGVGVGVGSLLLEQVPFIGSVKKLTDILFYAKWGGATTAVVGGAGTVYSVWQWHRSKTIQSYCRSLQLVNATAKAMVLLLGNEATCRAGTKYPENTRVSELFKELFDMDSGELDQETMEKRLFAQITEVCKMAVLLQKEVDSYANCNGCM